MNEERLRALYQLYLDKEIITKDVVTEEMWMNSSPEQVEGLWNLGIQNELITKDVVPLEMYQEDWGLSSVKKKEDGVSESADGISGGLSLEEIAMPQPEMFETPRDEFLSSPTMQVEEQVRTQVSKQRGEEDRRQTEIIRQKEVLESAKDLEQIQQAQQELEAFRGGDDLQSDLSLINENFTKRSEEEVIKDATKKYGKYGFIFEPARFGERMKVTTIDGSREIDIKLDIDSEDSERLKNFIAANAQMPEEVQDDDYINKAFKVKASRQSKLLNEDGTVSTVRMASADNFAFPTVFPKDPYNQTNNPEDWIVFDLNKKGDIKKAINLARERGEIYDFKTPEEANEFAEGGWKEVSISDIEGKKFFEERDLDYAKIIGAEKRLIEVQNEINFIQKEMGMGQARYNVMTGEMEGEYKPSEEKIKSRPDIFLPNGRIRSDVVDKLAELNKEADDLVDIVRTDSDVSRALEDYNLHLQKKFEEKTQESIVQNNNIKKELDVLDRDFERVFNMSFEEFAANKPSIPDQTRLDFFTDQVEARQALVNAKITAADTYFMGQTYYDDKTRKYIQKDFSENFEAWAATLNDGIQTGNAASVLLPLMLGMNINKEYSAEEIAKYMNNMSETQGRAYTRYTNAIRGQDKLNAFLSDPFEVFTSLAANSLGMLVPLGYEVVTDPKLLLAAAAPGAAYGFFRGGPKAALGGALSSTAAAVQASLEYTNSILDEANERGFNMADETQALQALQDEEIITKGGETGYRRAAAIFGSEFILGQFAGKIFKVSRTSNALKKATAQIAERSIYDPLTEGLGEMSAQIAAGQDININEILDEMAGGLGGKVQNAAINIFTSTDRISKINLAYQLTDRDILAVEKGSFQQISNWTSRMQKLGQIDESVANTIQENLALRKEAKDLLSLSDSKKNDKVLIRTMNLLKAQKTLGKSENSRKIYKGELASIENELSYMVKNGELAPSESMTDIKNIKDEAGNIVSLAPEVKSYSINGRKYTKKDFNRKINQMSEDKRKKASFEIVNDQEFKEEINNQYGIVPTSISDVVSEEIADFDAIGTERYDNMDEVPTEIQEAATVVEETDDGKYRIGEEVFDEIPSEVMDGDAVITQKQDGTVDVQYKESKFVLEDKPLTEVYDTREAIPQTIQDAASTQIVENDEGKFEVTYKESEVIGQVLGEQKERPSAPQFMMEDDVSQKQDPQLQLDTKVDTETRKKELEEQAIQQMEEVKIKDEGEIQRIRAANISGNRVGKGLSKKGSKNPIFEDSTELSVEYARQNPKLYINNANILAKEPIVRAKLKIDNVKTIEQADKIYDVFVREAANNLKFLANEFKEEYRETSTLWYDGANKIARDLSRKYNVTPEQAAGILASLSPQKDWYQNVRLAELVLIAYSDNVIMSEDMINKQIEINENSIKNSQLKKYNKAKQDYRKSRSKSNKQKLDEAKLNLDKRKNKLNDIIDYLKSQKGKTILEVNPNFQSFWVRLHHEINTTKDYDIVSPDGEKISVAKRNDGVNKKVAWGSYTEIGKAVSIYNDGSQQNITRTLGQMHKIRNFYNNIIDPMSKDGDVTIDTHAVAAALLEPLSGKSKKVTANFGTGTSNSAPLGIKGLYYAYSDAYALAAKELNLLPRQVQSITWEAIRGLYTDTFKNNSKNVNLIQEIWINYGEGKITIDEARSKAIKEAGGINDPTWASPRSKPSKKGSDAISKSKREGSRGIDKTTIRSSRGRGVIKDAPAKTRYQMFIEKLSQAFPSVQIVTSQKEFDALLRELNAKALATKDQKIYGAVYDGKLYLNPSLENFNTPIHEFGHIWLNTVKELRPDLYNKGISLIKDSDYLTQIKNNKEYKRVTDQMRKEGISEEEINQYLLEEALATAIGDKGESFATAAQERNFKGWLTDLFNFVKKLTGISKLSADQVQNMTLDEFLQGVVVDLLSENKLFKDAEANSISNQLQLMTSDGSKMSMDDIISKMRQEGFADEGIKGYLKNQGYKAEEINQAMAISIDMNTPLPDAFKNVFGGAKVGISMFNDIKKDLDSWVRSRWGKGKSFLEYRKKAMELLTDHPAFDSQTKINQDKLIAAMDVVIGRKPVKDVNAPIKSIKDTVKLLKNSNWKGDTKKAKRSFGLALRPLEGVKTHANNVAKIKKLIKGMNDNNMVTQVEQINTILNEIISENKRQKIEMDRNISSLRKNISSYEKGKKDSKQNLREIIKTANQLISDVDVPNKKELRAIINSIKKGVTNQGLDTLVGALNDLQNKKIFEAEKTQKLSDQISALKEKVKENKKQARDLKDIKLKVTREIKRATNALRALGVEKYSYASVQRLIYKVNNANIDNIDTVLSAISNEFANIEKKEKVNKIKAIKKKIKDYAKVAKTRSGRRTSKGRIDAEGVKFFQDASRLIRVLDAVKNDLGEEMLDAINTIVDLTQAMGKEQRDAYLEALKLDRKTKQAIGVAIRIIENSNDVVAALPELLRGMENMSLEELIELERDIDTNKNNFARSLANKKALEKEAFEKKREEVVDQIKAEFEYFFIENDEGELVMKSQSRLDKEERNQLDEKRNKIKDGLKGLSNRLQNPASLFKGGPINYLAHLGTICSALDNIPAGMKFFTENVYKALNKSYQSYLLGKERQLENLNRLAASINPNYKYKDIKRLIAKTQKKKGELELNGVIVDKKTEKSVYFTTDAAMRLYALSKNPIQRQKLIDMGVDIDQIENYLGSELMAFSDLVVNYLSTKEFDSLNAVYKDVNNVPLRKTENYFPVKTESGAAIASTIEADSNGDFSAGFNAQYQGFLRDRTNLKDPIKLNDNFLTFTRELEAHLDQSERYKAYAKTAKNINKIFNIPEVAKLLKFTKLRDLVNTLISNDIAPPQSKMTSIGRFMYSTVIRKTIGFKPIQTLKQYTSAILSFPEYNIKYTENLPGIVKYPLNAVPFVITQALNLPFLSPLSYSNFYKAYKMSPLFRARVNRFFSKAGYSAMETTLTEEQASNKIVKAFNMLTKVAGAFTFLGDIAGVMGYMPVYNQDIRNGMDPQKALEKFEDYNKTQQTQRNTEINLIQTKAKDSFVWGMLGVFQSSLFLLQNVAYSSVDNMVKTIKNAKGKDKVGATLKAFTERDAMRLYFSAGVSLGLFNATTFISKYLWGNEEDEEDFWDSVMMAPLGIIYAIPFLGTIVEGFTSDYDVTEGFNPINLMVKDAIKSFVKKEPKGIIEKMNIFSDKEDYTRTEFLLQYGLGINTDFFIGILNLNNSEDKYWYDRRGITKYARPKESDEYVDIDLFGEE
tara:strand:- start:4229 stop:14029 length:9801 start_codon:yes stop_codon:yes gene_type:complete